MREDRCEHFEIENPRDAELPHGVYVKEDSVDVDRIFKATLTDDRKRVVLVENCDSYYEGRATKEQLGKIIAGLAGLYSRMVP